MSKEVIVIQSEMDDNGSFDTSVSIIKDGEVTTNYSNPLPTLPLSVAIALANHKDIKLDVTTLDVDSDLSTMLDKYFIERGYTKPQSCFIYVKEDE